MIDYQAIIFDLGNVVFNCSHEKIFAYFAGLAHIPLAQLKRQFIFDEPFRQFEKGEIGSGEIIRHISHNLNYNLSEEQFIDGWNSIYQNSVPGIQKFLVEMKKSFRIVALTNTNIIHEKIWKAKYSNLLSNFEQIFSSHEIGTRKPEPAAYNIVLDYLKIDPEQVVFLDDLEENTLAAEKLGLKSILVKSFKQMERDLEKLGLFY